MASATLSNVSKTKLKLPNGNTFQLIYHSKPKLISETVHIIVHIVHIIQGITKSCRPFISQGSAETNFSCLRWSVIGFYVDFRLLVNAKVQIKHYHKKIKMLYFLCETVWKINVYKI